MHKIIEEILDADIPVTLIKVDGDIHYRVDGFYKSGNVTLIEKDENTMLVKQRWDKEDEIYSLHDLAEINKNWLIITRERNSGYTIDPDRNWLPVLMKLGLIEKRINVSYE